MPEILLAEVTFGGYISIVKFLFVLVGFFCWMPLVNWVYMDVQAVRTNKLTWTFSLIGAGVTGLLLWLLIPAFFIGLLIYIIIAGATTMAYVMHRNARVADFEKVLTAEHIRTIFVNDEKKIMQSSHGLSFETGHGNEVPLPTPKSPEADGFAIVCELIDDAFWRRAEEIKMIPQKEDYAVIYEIDGVSMKQEPIDREDMEDFIPYLKQLASLDKDEKRKPQEGNFSAIKDKDYNQKSQWNVKTAGSTAGEQVHITRVETLVSRKVKELGLNDNQFESINTLKNVTQGVVIISGPRRSGVTTTFYSLLGNHDPFLNNIITLEKNPAVQLDNITQNEYTLSDTGAVSYGRSLLTLIRRGPDIIGVADCEDAETAKVALEAANDGKIVYVSFEADNVNAAVEKWLKLAGDKDMVADTLVAVVNQRLVRTLCTQCRQAYQPNQALFKKFNIPANEVGMFYRPGEIEYDKHGKEIICDNCQGTGFYGRVGLFETIRLNDALKQVVRTAKSSSEIGAAFRKAGMLYMQEQSIKKVSGGITSINEIIRNFSVK